MFDRSFNKHRWRKSMYSCLYLSLYQENNHTSLFSLRLLLGLLWLPAVSMAANFIVLRNKLLAIPKWDQHWRMPEQYRNGLIHVQLGKGATISKPNESIHAHCSKPKKCIWIQLACMDFAVVCFQPISVHTNYSFVCLSIISHKLMKALLFCSFFFLPLDINNPHICAAPNPTHTSRFFNLFKTIHPPVSSLSWAALHFPCSCEPDSYRQPCHWFLGRRRTMASI